MPVKTSAPYESTASRPGFSWARLAMIAVSAVAIAITVVVAPTTTSSPQSADSAVQYDPAAWETLIDGSFQDRQTLESEWNYLYPWGSDHNGSARMYASSTDLSQQWISPTGVLNIRATRISGNEGNSGHDPWLPIRYHSAAFHSKDQIVVNDQYPTYEVRGEFQAPSAPGTWPAFWITGVNSWPPESDILEYKGDNRNWFNTYDGSWDNTIVTVGDPAAWHEYRIWMTKINATDVEIQYFLDGQLRGTHIGSNFVDQPMWVIINLQMEGSSGSSGPGGETDFKARNVYVGRDNTSGGGNGGGGGQGVEIQNRYSGLCLDDYEWGTEPGAEVRQWTCNGAEAQQWEVVDAGGGYVTIRNTYSGLCLDDYNWGTEPGAEVRQWTCTGGSNQQWQLADAGGGYSTIVNRYSGLCLDDYNWGTEDGAEVRQWTCTGGSNQQWAIG